MFSIFFAYFSHMSYFLVFKQSLFSAVIGGHTPHFECSQYLQIAIKSSSKKSPAIMIQ